MTILKIKIYTLTKRRQRAESRGQREEEVIRVTSNTLCSIAQSQRGYKPPANATVGGIESVGPLVSASFV
jgi:hypothetical protein